MNTRVLSLVLAASAAAPAWAAKVNHPKCDDVLTISDKFTPQYLAVVDGYSKAGKKSGEDLDIGGFVTESTELRKECAKNKATNVPAAHHATADKKTINPVAAKCEDFVALDEVYQPVAAYWVAGHDKNGKLIKNGELEEEYLSRPVMTLVEDCKAHPKLPFYARAKAWMQKHI